MSTITLEEYLVRLNGPTEIPYLNEGLREIAEKFNAATLKKMVQKLHLALNKNDKNAMGEISKNLRTIKKTPKYKDVQDFSEGIKGDHPEISEAAELSKKVLKNTFKIRDKAKLEILGNAVASAAWIESKGKKHRMLSNTKIILHKIGDRFSSIYDTGIEGEGEDDSFIRSQVIRNAQKQESIERIIVLVILSLLVTTFIFAGVVIWSILTSKLVLFLATMLIMLTAIGKVLQVNVGG